jgi:general secretion pathway protein C
MGRLPSSTLLVLALSSCSNGTHRLSLDHKNAVAPAHARSADAILERNPFDSATGPLNRVDQGFAPLSPQLDGPTCRDIKLRRVVLSVSPEWSFAELSSEKLPVLLHLGSSFRDRHLASIEADRVWMAGKDGACHADLGGQTLVSSPACVASRFTLGPPCIERRADGSFDVAKAMLDHVLEDQAELMRSARVIPETDGHGRVIGIRLFGVRPGSLMGALGFENGDTLVTINDLDLTSPDRALEAYARLRSVTELRFGLRRRGQAVVLVHRLR